MGRESRGILFALDKAKIQWYHFRAIIIAGMGFFTDAYDLFSITCVTNLLGRIYYPENNDPGDCQQRDCPGILPPDINNAVIGVALVGTLIGHLTFGVLGDKLGRKNVYGVILILMAQSAIGSGLSVGKNRKAVLTTLCFFRFWLGFAIGGDYPISATIMAEYANQKTRGGFMAAVFAMQGCGIVTAGLVSMIVSASFKRAFTADYDKVVDQVNTQVPEADYVWRIILMFGAVPALLTYYWRMQMPETARFTALVEGNAKKAAADMAKILDVELEAEPGDSQAAHEYPLLSREFLRRHGKHLLGTAATWFLLDIVFYNNNLTQKDVFGHIKFLRDPASMDAIDEVFRISTIQFLVSLFATVPGYWFTVLLIDHVGRLKIQLVGFFMMSAFLVALGILYNKVGNEKDAMFLVLYCLTFFFANFGPNSTTFVVSAELFPARMRSTCHGISAAAGKAGAIVGAFGIHHLTQTGKLGLTLKLLAVAPALGFFFTFLLPETKGRSLEEISGEDHEIGEQPALRCNGTAPVDGDSEVVAST